MPIFKTPAEYQAYVAGLSYEQQGIRLQQLRNGESIRRRRADYDQAQYNFAWLAHRIPHERFAHLQLTCGRNYDWRPQHGDSHSWLKR